MRSIFNFIGFVAIIVSITLISCDKDSNNTKCNVSNPAEDLDWLEISLKLTPFFHSKLTPPFHSKLTPLFQCKLTPQN